MNTSKRHNNRIGGAAAPELTKCAFALNPDGGGVFATKGRPTVVSVQAGEKMYADFVLTAKHPGGHSSMPDGDNAILRIAKALRQIGDYEFPIELNDITRTSLVRRARRDGGQIAADVQAVVDGTADPAVLERFTDSPVRNAMVRTTCVPTGIRGGHAANALPQSAHATVNCRILPGHSASQVQQVLASVIADPKVSIEYLGADGKGTGEAPGTVAPAPVDVPPVLLKAISKVAARFWPEVPVAPTMIPGASDSIKTAAAGIPTFGVSGVLLDSEDLPAHGTDERVRVDSFFRGNAFFYELLKELTSITPPHG